MSATSAGRSVMVQGRIVWCAGDLFKGKVKTDPNTRQPVIDQRTGTQRIEYGFGLAVPKSLLNQTGKDQPGEIWAAIHEEAYTLYPSRQLPPAFAMKFKDGDGVDHNGQSFAQREGHAGHLIFSCTTSLPIKFYKFEAGANILVNEGIKCGDYVNVQLHIKAHPAQGQGKAGLYLNPNAVQLIGYGKEIVNTPSGDQVFGVQAPAVPQGASATPIAPPGFIQPPSQFAPPPQAPAPQPHYGPLPPQFAPPSHQQAPNGFAPPAAVPTPGYPQAVMPQAPIAPMPAFQPPGAASVPQFPYPPQR